MKVIIKDKLRFDKVGIAEVGQGGVLVRIEVEDISNVSKLDNKDVTVTIEVDETKAAGDGSNG